MTEQAKEQRRKYYRRYREEHREELRAYNRKYQQEHREELKAKKRIYRQSAKGQETLNNYWQSKATETEQKQSQL